jgi:hypothetical protein
MKKNQLVFAMLALAAGLFFSAHQADAQIKPMKPNRLPEGVTILNTSNILLLNDIDLAAESINFSIVKVRSQFSAVVKIEGVVRNVGKLTYTSGANQQSVRLYEQNGGIGTRRLVASRPFQNLAPNATVKVSFTRNWNKSSPAEGEFPPTYVLVIGFEPDITIDGNNSNDDSNSENNSLTKSGREINTMTFKKL